MKAKLFAKYDLSQSRGAIGVFYLVIAALILVAGILSRLLGSSGIDGSFNGLEWTSVIFLFVAGLNSFKPYFYFACANGISRKSMFLGELMSSGAICLLMAIMDVVIVALLPLVVPQSQLLYEAFFTGDLPLIQEMGLTFLLGLFLNCLAFALGYLITIAYYRMNTRLKVLVSVGVPAVFTLLGAAGLLRIPMPTTLTGILLLCLAATFLCLLFSFLLLRNAQVKG